LPSRKKLAKRKPKNKMNSEILIHKNNLSSVKIDVHLQGQIGVLLAKSKSTIMSIYVEKQLAKPVKIHRFGNSEFL
jgi:hypothetical protein